MSTRLLAVHHGGGLGGAPVSMLKLLARLDRSAFYPIAVFTEPGYITQYATELEVPVETVPTGGAFFYSAHARLGLRSIVRFLRSFPSSIRIAQQVLRYDDPELVHLNTSVLLGWATAARRQGVPVVWVVREVLGPNPWLRRWHADFILRHARRVVAISDAVAACFPRPVERVYNAVDLSDFRLDLLDQAPAVRQALGIGPSSPVLMVIGSVQRPKGHWLLLDAFGRLSPEVHLVLVTGGVESGYARTLRGRVKNALDLPLDNLDAFLRDAHHRGVADRVHVTGYRTDVARMLAAADVLVFPSLEPEGFGRPIIEAMALARPVVATDVGPSAELIGPEAGRLVPPDADHVARGISEVLASPELREHMGRAGRRRVECRFGLDRQMAEMSRIYGEALLSSG